MDGSAAATGGGVGHLAALGAGSAASGPAPASARGVTSLLEAAAAEPARPAPDKAPAPAEGKAEKPTSTPPAQPESSGDAPLASSAAADPSPPKPAAQTIYLSNDDSMSLSSAQRVEMAIERFLPIPMQHLRPHEFLNYFQFHTEPVAPGRTFSVRGDLVRGDEPDTWTLALAVAGRSVDRSTRSRATLTLVVDVSGSMRSEGKMAYLKRGLTRMIEELRPGDLVNVVEFDNRAFVSLENFVVGRDDAELLRLTISELRPRGGTNLHAGLTTGYRLAKRYKLAGSRNKVILITDALTNVGRTSPRLLAEVGQQIDREGIELSGVGVGQRFNDRLLDRLTERGRGAYVFLGSERVTERVFGRDFTSLLETVARDVRFKLVLPPSLRMKTYYGEEASTVREEVKTIHYFAGTRQLFLSDLEQVRPPADGDVIVLEAEYRDPASGAERRERFEFKVGAIRRGAAPNPAKGKALMALTDLLAELGPVAPRRVPVVGGRIRPGWHPPPRAAAQAPRCAAGLDKVEQRLAGADPSDAEVERIRVLGRTFCERFGQVKANRVNRFAPKGR